MKYIKVCVYVWKIFSQYLRSQIMSDNISENDNKIRLETEYFHANDRLASRATSLKFHADHSNVSIIANWKVTCL